MRIHRRLTSFAMALCMMLAASCENMPDLAEVLTLPDSGGALSTSMIAQGLSEALVVGSQRVASGLGKQDGFFGTPYKIPLPKTLTKARDIAAPLGFGGVFDELELKLNRAAEAAAPKAGELFVGAIRAMTFDDVMRIYRGGDDAATRYLREQTESQLRTAMQPVVAASLRDVGAAQLFDTAVTRYNKLPLVSPIKANLNDHVLGYANDALFAQLAKEESAIRNDPLKRSTELLRRVFANPG